MLLRNYAYRLPLLRSCLYRELLRLFPRLTLKREIICTKRHSMKKLLPFLVSVAKNVMSLQLHLKMNGVAVMEVRL